MNKTSSKIAALSLALVTMATTTMVAGVTRAESVMVDPAAAQILQSMTNYLGNVKQFTVHTENNIEDILDSGQRVDISVSASVIISRPNKLRAERTGELLSQYFYYDGNTLTLYNPDSKVFASEAAPATIPETLDFARESLGLMVPVSDLIYDNAYSLLMQGVTSAIIVGKSEIDGNVCNHLAFSRPDVDFQVWVMEGDKPLPCKYVVTDTSTPQLLSISTVMSKWNISPSVDNSSFEFVPTKNAEQIKFMSASTDNLVKSGASK